MTSWKLHAACRDLSPELFFPELHDPGTGQSARAVCASCPVRADCLAAAIATPQNDDFGIWGGTGPLERRALRKFAQAGNRRTARGGNRDPFVSQIAYRRPLVVHDDDWTNDLTRRWERDRVARLAVLRSEGIVA